MNTQEASEASKSNRSAVVKALEEEGDYAADYLESLLDILDLDGEIDIYVENDRAGVSIVGDNLSTRRLQRLVGEDGDVLNAIQDLTRLAIQAQTGDRSRCMVDIAGHRAGLRSALTVKAQDAVAQVKETGQSCSLEPMNPFERKVVHDAVAAAGLRSDSEGEEPHRYVVIHPAEG